MPILSRIYWKFYRKLSGDQRIIPLPPRVTKDFQDPTKIKVFILTYCKWIQQLYGTTLIFQSIRTGFPNAIITVIDNASVPSARKEIKQLALSNNCRFFQIENEVPHHVYLQDLIMDQPLAGTVVNLDPDIVLWKNCENWHFNALLAGGLIPAHNNELSPSNVRPRLHSSFYWIQDIEKLRNKIKYFKRISGNEFDPFRPVAIKEGKRWYRYDTGSTLYMALQKYCYCFTKKEYSAYNHIIGGTHLNIYINKIKVPKTKQLLRRLHTFAKTNPMKLHGMWKPLFQHYKDEKLMPTS